MKIVYTVSLFFLNAVKNLAIDFGKKTVRGMNVFLDMAEYMLSEIRAVWQIQQTYLLEKSNMSGKRYTAV